MSTSTTLKLPAELKKRIAPLVERTGKSPHAWMVEALEREAALAEMREEFIQSGLDSAADVDAGGPLFASEDVHAWLLERTQGRRVARPRPVASKRRR
jgi:predicted transcriptional regulator